MKVAGWWRDVRPVKEARVLLDAMNSKGVMLSCVVATGTEILYDRFGLRVKKLMP